MEKNDQAPEAPCELKLFGNGEKPSPPDARMSSREAEVLPFEEQSRRPWCGARSIEADLQRKVTKKLATDGLLRRTPSGSGGGAGLAADLCGESDLTAEHHIGEESSSNYHDHGSSMVDGGEESPSAISNAQFRPGLHLIAGKPLQLNSDSANGGGVIRPFPIPGAARLQARLLAQPSSLSSGVPASSHGILQGIGDGKSEMMQDGISIAHAVMEPPATAAPPNNRPGTCSTAQQSSVTSSSSESPHGTGRDWLQLCVGSSLNGDTRNLSRPDSDVDLDAHRLGRGRNDEGFGVESAEHTTGISNSVSAPWDVAIEPDRSSLQTIAKKVSPWHGNIQAEKSISTGGAPPKISEILRSAPASNAVQNGVGYLEAGPKVPAGTTSSNVGSFGNASHLSGGAGSPGAIFFSQPGPGVTARLVSSNAAEHSFSSHGEVPELRGSFLRYNGGDHGVPDMVQNQHAPKALSKGGVEDGKGGAAHAVNLPTDLRSVVHFQQDGSQQHSLGDWIQAQGKLSHNAWPAGSGQHFFISPANGFQVQNMTTTQFPVVSQLKDVSAFSPVEVFRGDDSNARPSFPFDTHHQHQHQHHQNVTNSDHWERLRGKVGPGMVFQSQSFPVHEGATSIGVVHNLARSNSKCGELGSKDSDDKISALKAAFETIQGNSSSQMQASEGVNLIRPAAWWHSSHQVGGHPHPLVKAHSGPETFTSLEREGHPSFLSDRFQLQQTDQRSDVLAEHTSIPSIQRQSWQQPPILGHKPEFQQGYWNALQRVPSVPAPVVPAKRQMLLPQTNGDSKDARHAGLWFVLRSGETQDEEGGLPQISKAYLRIRDGKMPVSAVKKYLVSKLGLASEAEVDITCKGQPIVSSLSLQHVRDSIWFSNRSKPSDSHRAEASPLASPPVPTTSDVPSLPRLDRSSMESNVPRNTPHEPPENGDQGSVLPPTTVTSATVAKDIVMVLMYRRHHPSGALQLSNFLT